MAFGRWGKEGKKKEEAKKFPIRVYVATPAYDGKVDTDYAVSLAESSMYAVSNGIHVTAGVMGNGAFIDLARCNFVNMFLRTDCTHLLFIDADLKWEPRAFLGLVTSGRPVCAGVYRRRQEPESYPCRYIESEDGGISTTEGGWIKCNRVPTGFLCIERRIIEEMAAEATYIKQPDFADVPRLFYTKLTEEGYFMGEDFCFCDDYVAKYNEPIYVWPDFDFVHGGYKCNWHKYINEQVDKYDQSIAAGAEPALINPIGLLPKEKARG
jgi:hypothetical protein